MDDTPLGTVNHEHGHWLHDTLAAWDNDNDFLDRAGNVWTYQEGDLSDFMTHRPKRSASHSTKARG